MATCEPKQLNNCEKAGSGPECNTDPKSSGPKKQACLDRVKENCEGQLKKCIEKCSKDALKKYQDEKEAKEKARKQKIEARRKREAECQKNETWKKADTLQREDFAGARFCVELRRRKECPQCQGGYDNAVSQGTALNQGKAKRILLKDSLAKLSNSELDGQCKAHEAFQKYQQDVKDKICPPDDDKEKVDDPCEADAVRRFNRMISACIGNCYWNATDDCTTRHCYCGSLKCEGPDMEWNSLGPVEKDPQPQPGKDPTFGTGTIAFTLSSYGIPIELVYTKHVMPGNVVWVSPVTEEQSMSEEVTFDQSIQKFVKNTKVTIDNYISMHLGLCAGPLAAISRIWLNATLVYDGVSDQPIEPEGQSIMEMRKLLGGEGQKVMREASEQEGFGRVPAYRGTAGLYISDLNVSGFTQFPVMKVEVIRKIESDFSVKTGELPADVVDGIFEVDIAARRVYIQTADDRVEAVDLDSLEPVAGVDVVNPRHMTAFPTVMEIDGNDVAFRDFTYAELSTPETAPADIDSSFIWRHLDYLNEGFDMLVATNDAGEVRAYYYDDLTRRLFNDPLADFDTPLEFDTALGGRAEAFCPARMRRVEASTGLDQFWDSLFMFRADGASLLYAELVGNSTDGIARFAFDENFYEGEITNLIPDATTLTIKGVTATGDSGIMFFLDSDQGEWAVKWHPQRGVDWRSEGFFPEMGDHPWTRPTAATEYVYIVDEQLYSINVETGEITELMLDVEPGSTIQQRQWFDGQTGTLVYIADDNTQVIKLRYQQLQPTTETLADVARDLLRRGGTDLGVLDVSDIEGIEVTGYRSGANETGRQIMSELMQVYLAGAYGADRLTFLRRTTENVVAINEDWLAQAYSQERMLDAYEKRSATVTYYSVETDGQTASQSFSLPDDFRSGTSLISFGFNVLENDQYMRRLAELLVYGAQEADTKSKIGLPWRYIGLTASDTVLVRQKYRLAMETIQGDGLASEFELREDSTGKYSELIEITAQEGFRRFENTFPLGPIPFPFATAQRCVTPQDRNGGCVYYGLAAVVDDFPGSGVVSVQRDEQNTSPGTFPQTMTRLVSWGRLVTPPTYYIDEFTTQPTNSLTIRFETPAMADRFRELGYNFLTGVIFDPDTDTFRYTEVDFMQREPTRNLLYVGNEMIQFRDAVVDIDGVTVTFSCLTRGRFCTEYWMRKGHTAGEVCWHYDPETIMRVEAEIDDTDFQQSQKIAVTSPRGVARRQDRALNRRPDIFGDVSMHGTTRWDRTAASPSAFFPDNPDIELESQFRMITADPFQDHIVNTDINTESFLPFNALYLLRAPFDLSTFQAKLLDNSTDYIMVREAAFEFPQDNTGRINMLYQFTTDIQDQYEWDAATEPLVAVVHTGSLEFNRCVTRWTPGNYFRSPTRGL